MVRYTRVAQSKALSRAGIDSTRIRLNKVAHPYENIKIMSLDIEIRIGRRIH
jgi:hypothetical protein